MADLALPAKNPEAEQTRLPHGASENVPEAQAMPEIFDPQGVLVTGAVSGEIDGRLIGFYGIDKAAPEAVAAKKLKERAVPAAELRELIERYQFPPGLQRLEGWEEVEEPPAEPKPSNSDLKYPAREQIPPVASEIPAYQPQTPESSVATNNLAAITTEQAGLPLKALKERVLKRIKGSSSADLAHNQAAEAANMHKAAKQETL